MRHSTTSSEARYIKRSAPYVYLSICVTSVVSAACATVGRKIANSIRCNRTSRSLFIDVSLRFLATRSRGRANVGMLRLRSVCVLITEHHPRQFRAGLEHVRLLAAGLTAATCEVDEPALLLIVQVRGVRLVARTHELNHPADARLQLPLELFGCPFLLVVREPQIFRGLAQYPAGRIVHIDTPADAGNFDLGQLAQVPVDVVVEQLFLVALLYRTLLLLVLLDLLFGARETLHEPSDLLADWGQ